MLSGSGEDLSMTDIMPTDGQGTQRGPVLKPRIVASADGTSICASGIPMNIMLRAEDTGGAFAALVAKFEPRQGPPLNLHHDHEEYFFVRKGDCELSTGAGSIAEL
jgi:hypothetical protein